MDKRGCPYGGAAQELPTQHNVQTAAKQARPAPAGKGAKPFEVYDSGRYDYDEIDALARRKLKKIIGKE